MLDSLFNTIAISTENKCDWRSTVESFKNCKDVSWWILVCFTIWRSNLAMIYIYIYTYTYKHIYILYKSMSLRIWVYLTILCQPISYCEMRVMIIVLSTLANSICLLFLIMDYINMTKFYNKCHHLLNVFVHIRVQCHLQLVLITNLEHRDKSVLYTGDPLLAVILEISSEI